MTPETVTAIGTMALAIIALVSLGIAFQTTAVLRQTVADSHDAKMVEVVASCIGKNEVGPSAGLDTPEDPC